MQLKLKAILFCIVIVAGTATFAQSPQLPQTQQELPGNVSDAELEKFAETVQALQVAEQESQQRMIAIVKAQDIDIEKFNEIHQAKRQKQEVKASEADQKKHDEAVAKLEEIQPEIMKLMEEIIIGKGLTVDRFHQIATLMQSSVELQQRFQQIITE